jgi:cellulose synthase/poly-beta-1,6-N-acetylglucosamine synthase-like glycosyltransferase
MELNSQPFVSILIAARNEEANISVCLNALINQDYPNEKIEIWVGNDQSEDGTAAIIQSFVQGYPNIDVLEIDAPLKHLRGKANVLAQLANKAKGDYLFITDADVIVEPTWITSMLTYFTGSVGVITGVTAVEGESLFAKLQNAEWLYYTAHGHNNAQSGRPVTAMGNNMAVSGEAYFKTGGYENIPFSITEDFELFRNILKIGFTFKTAFEHNVLGYTKPHPSFKGLLHQRKRWFTGAFQLPVGFVIGLVGLWAFLPILLLIVYFFGWKIVAGIFFLKWITDIFFLFRSYKQLQLPVDIGVWIYTPVSAICNTIFLFYQFLPIPVQWKGRKYHKTSIS